MSPNYFGTKGVHTCTCTCTEDYIDDSTPQLYDDGAATTTTRLVSPFLMSSDSDLLCGDWLLGTGPSYAMINGVVSVSMSCPVIKPWTGVHAWPSLCIKIKGQ